LPGQKKKGSHVVRHLTALFFSCVSLSLAGQVSGEPQNLADQINVYILLDDLTSSPVRKIDMHLIIHSFVCLPKCLNRANKRTVIFISASIENQMGKDHGRMKFFFSLSI